MNADLALALELADVADRIASARFRAVDLVVSTKPDKTPVTEADKAVEHALRELLATERPDHAIVGEEFGTAGESEWRWIIDPIDATANYLRGVPVWATLIALAKGDEPVVGVVSAPALQRRWWASRGDGAFLNGEPIRVSQVAAIADAHLSSYDYVTWERFDRGQQFLELARRCWRTRSFGDFWGHMLVAEGSVDICLEPIVAAWDVAPIQVIVEEAGGRFTDLRGKACFDGGDACSTNGLLHDETLRAMVVP